MSKYCPYDELPLLMTVEELMPVLGIGRNIYLHGMNRGGEVAANSMGRLLK